MIGITPPAPIAEIDLVIACARVELDDSSRRCVLELLEKPLDWPRVLEFAGRHGLRPLLHRHLSSLPHARVPKPVLVDLWGGYESGLRRNREAARDLARIVADFTTHGIPALPYKGPVLAATTYGHLGLREFGDLDILVRLTDIARATQLLEAAGYRAEFDLESAAAAAMFRSWRGYDVHLRKPPLLVELHWRTDADFPMEIDDPRWWRELPRIQFEGVMMATLDPTELLLVLGIHGGKHGWAALGWVVDIAELLRREPGIDWAAIRTRARTLGIERRLYVGLALAAELFGAPLPSQAREVCGRRDVSRVSQRIRADVLCIRRAPDSAVRNLRGELELYDHARHRLKHAARTIFSPSMAELSRWPLPRSLYFVHVPLRLARLMGKYVFNLRFLRNRADATPRTPPPRPHSTG